MKAKTMRKVALVLGIALVAACHHDGSRPGSAPPMTEAAPPLSPAPNADPAPSPTPPFPDSHAGATAEPPIDRATLRSAVTVKLVALGYGLAEQAALCVSEPVALTVLASVSAAPTPVESTLKRQQISLFQASDDGAWCVAP